MDKAARAALLTAKGMDKTSENIADYVADLLRQGRAKEITDDLMAQADPQRLHHHYTTGNTGMDLPMDQASRMARAKGMGFDAKSYHGTHADFPAFDNRAYAASNYGTHSGEKDAADIILQNAQPRYAKNRGAPDYADNAVVLPLMAKTKNNLRIEDTGEWEPDEVLATMAWNDNPDTKNMYHSIVNDASYPNFGADAEKTKFISDSMSKSGHTGFTYNNEYEGGGDSYATLDPTNIRSQFARFDPRLDHLAHLSASTGGAMDFARHVEAVQRAGGQIAPSKYLPNVPRQVHADGGKVAYHATHEPFEDYDWSRLGQSTKENTSGTSVDDWASSLASLGPWSHEKPLSKRLGMKTDLPVTLTGKEKKFKSLDHLAQEISQHGGPAALREKLVSQGYGHASVDDEEFGGKSYVGLSPDHFKITKAGGGKVAFMQGNHPLVPEVLYHGTARDIQSFDPDAKRSYDVDPSNPEETDTGWFGKGHYFTASPKLAAHYADEGAKRQGGQGASIIPAHVAMKNPFVVDMKAYDSGAKTLDNALSRAGVPMHPRGYRMPSEQTAALVGMGHDGVIATREGKPEEYVAFHPTQIKSAIGNQGTFDPNDPDITKADGGRVGYEDGGDVGGTEPKNTVKAYKLFKRKKDGNIYPLFVNANKPVPIGQWLDAEEGPQGKSEGKVKSSLGDLAYRPGWHAGDLPVATHIGGKSRKELTAPDYRPDDHVWAEVEMPNDVDWQSVANSRMRRTADGRPILNTAHITDQLPKGGFYRYKTNPNMTGNWLIGGSMKVNRILPDDEVKQINDAAGTADLPRMPKITKAGGGDVEGDNGHIYVVHGGSDFDQIDPSYSGRGEPGNIRPLGNGLYGDVIDHTDPELAARSIEGAKHYARKYGRGEKTLHVFKVPKSSSTVFNGYREVNVENYPKPIEGLGLEPTEELNAYRAHENTPQPPYDPENSADYWAHSRKSTALWNAVKNAADLRMQHLPIGVTEVAIQNPKVATRIGKFSLDTPTSDILDAVKGDVQGGNITKAGGGSVTDTDEFRNWFRNSATHTDGDPHVLYTGTSKDKDFTSFNVGRHGAWFTRDPAEASEYAERNDSQGYKQDGWKLTPINTASRVIPAYVKAENPYTGDLPDEVLRDNYKKAQSDWFDTLRRKGHDAWIPARHNGNLVVVLKEPQQIKSIFNNGKFDPNQKHMNKAGGGEVDSVEMNNQNGVMGNEVGTALVNLAPRAQAGELRDAGGVRGGLGVLQAQNEASLEGLPTKVSIPLTGGSVSAGHDPRIRQIARDYMASTGLPYNPPTKYAKVDPKRASRIAAAYDEMKDNASEPLTKASYDAMIKETMAQYHAAKNAGFKAEFWNPDTEEDPYKASPRLATEDVRNNHHMWVYPTRSGYGSDGPITAKELEENPLLQNSGETWNGQPVTVNDIFRAVHDYFGHAKEGVGFRGDGEENAWRSHAAMYSPLARMAMTSETRGQNSWLNYGVHGEKNRNARTEDTVFAPQKVGILPHWAHHEGAEDFMGPEEVNAMAAIRKVHGRASGGSVDAALALTRRFTKDGAGATVALKPKGK